MRQFGNRWRVLFWLWMCVPMVWAQESGDAGEGEDKAEGEDKGYCPCHDANNPCPQNSCLQDICFGSACLSTGLACTTNEDCQVCTIGAQPCLSDADCPTLACEIYEDVDYGGCVSARACGLDDGQHCPAP